MSTVTDVFLRLIMNIDINKYPFLAFLGSYLAVRSVLSCAALQVRYAAVCLYRLDGPDDDQLRESSVIVVEAVQ